MEAHQFTLEEANGLLGWLESKFAQLDPYRQELLRHQERAKELFAQGRGNGSSHMEEELHRVEQLVEELENGVQDIMEEIAGRGVVVKNRDEGLVDFPSMRDGREVFLCWVRGEAEIEHWHELDAGFAGRQPL